MLGKGLSLSYAPLMHFQNATKLMGWFLGPGTVRNCTHIFFLQRRIPIAVLPEYSLNLRSPPRTGFTWSLRSFLEERLVYWAGRGSMASGMAVHRPAWNGLLVGA